MGWTNAGEWLEYSVNVSAAGNYDIAVRVAGAVGGTVRLEFDGVDKTGNLTVPNTGGWQSWQTVTATGVSLSAGSQIMRIYMNSGGYNLNNVTITTASGGGGGSAYRIKNRWQGTYLYDNGSQAAYGNPSVGDQSSHWTLESVDGHTAIKNVATGDYLNIETLQSYVECTNIGTGAWSAQWALEDFDGHKRIRNRWQSGDYVHIENLTGYAQHGSVYNGAYSGHWTLEAVSGSRLGAELIPTQVFSSSVAVYPNPFTSQVQIKIQSQEGKDHQISVWDMSGKQALYQVESADEHGVVNQLLNTASLKAGIYFFKVQSGEQLKTFKMIKD